MQVRTMNRIIHIHVKTKSVKSHQYHQFVYTSDVIPLYLEYIILDNVL